MATTCRKPVRTSEHHGYQFGRMDEDGILEADVVGLSASGLREAETNPHRQVSPDGEVLRFDVTEVELVGEVVVKVGHHVQET